MGLSGAERRYLKAFEEEYHKKGSEGWLGWEKAAQRSGVDGEGGSLVVRLAAHHYLEQRGGYKRDQFRITLEGLDALKPWYWRHLDRILAVILGLRK